MSTCLDYTNRYPLSLGPIGDPPTQSDHSSFEDPDCSYPEDPITLILPPSNKSCSSFSRELVETANSANVETTSQEDPNPLLDLLANQLPPTKSSASRYIFDALTQSGTYLSKAFHSFLSDPYAKHLFTPMKTAQQEIETLFGKGWCLGVCNEASGLMLKRCRLPA